MPPVKQGQRHAIRYIGLETDDPSWNFGSRTVRYKAFMGGKRPIAHSGRGKGGRRRWWWTVGTTTDDF